MLRPAMQHTVLPRTLFRKIQPAVVALADDVGGVQSLDGSQ
jgi:hypothetical protein